jgi:phosphatidylglycerol:prolipoprotein diacylglycerol transferase
MYPNFRYFVYDWTGIDVPALAVVQMYGFWLAMAFLASGFFLMVELRRRESIGWLKGVYESETVGAPAPMGELIAHFLLGFLLGFKAVYYVQHNQEVTDAATFLLSATGNWFMGLLLGGVFAGWTWYEKHRQRLPQPKTVQVLVMPHQRVADIVILAAMSGIVGAKLYYHLTEWDRFVRNPVGELLSPAGLTVYGGLILGFFVVSWYLRRKKIAYGQMLDACAPALILAYGIGRLGCHFSGDGDWGIPAGPKPGWLAWAPDWIWAQWYPNNVLNGSTDNAPMHLMSGDPACNGFAALIPPGGTLSDGYCHCLDNPVYPTSLYEFVLCMGIFALLWGIARRNSLPTGAIFALYLVLNGLERFSIETIRINHKVLGNFTDAQLIALTLFALGIAGCLYVWKKGERMKVGQSGPETGEE